MKKLNQKGFTKWILIIILVAVALAVFLFLWQSNTEDSSENQASTEQTDESSQSVDEVPETQTAQLIAVNGYSGSGEATRAVVNGVYNHEITANLDDPAPGKFFEGWIVGASVISTGKLEKEAQGMWSLVYTGSESFISYDDIVVTEETEADGLDGNPEIHVLEGAW